MRHDGQIALVLEDLPGVSLRRWLESRSAATLEQRLRIAAQLAKIVAEVHAANVIHKDISSHNIVYDAETGRCTLIDFGIATRLRSEENKFQAPAALEGTLAYIAPEQTGRMNRSLDYRADLYSLGVTLYELFTGVLPHESADPLEMVHFHIAGKPTPPRERVGGVPLALSDIVMKLLQKEPENRYQSAIGLAADLDVCRTALAAGGAFRRSFSAPRTSVDRFEPPRSLYGRGAETQVLLRSFERCSRQRRGRDGRGPRRHRQDVARAGDIPADHAATRLLHRRQVRSAAAERAVQRARDGVAGSRPAAAHGKRGGDSTRGAARSKSRAAERPVADRRLPALELIIGQQPRVPSSRPFEAQNRFNLVFQNFLQVFCKRVASAGAVSRRHAVGGCGEPEPRDADRSARATESLLLVMTYRDNEVTANHPFMLAVNEQAKQGCRSIRDAATVHAPQVASSSPTRCAKTSRGDAARRRSCAKRPAAIHSSCANSCRRCTIRS